VVQIRVTPKTRNPFIIKALSISGVTWKWHFLNHAPARLDLGAPAALDRVVDADHHLARRQVILAGAKISVRDYLSALREREGLKQDFAAALTDFDALLTPTTETTASAVDAVDQGKAPARFTRFANLLELCGLAVPNGITAEGLPTSLQIVCRGYDEATALRIGWAFQATTDWHNRAPTGL